MDALVVFPSLAVARLGESDCSCLPAHETSLLTQSGAPDRDQIRDFNQRLCRQAARFRVYSLGGGDEWCSSVCREITRQAAEIRWTIRAVNSKAARPGLNPIADHSTLTPVTLICDSGEVEGRIQRPVVRLEGTVFGEVCLCLGEARLEDSGRLLLVGGFGRSASPWNAPLTGAVNSGWYDDTSDGYVYAEVRFHGTTTWHRTRPARFVVAPPKYAPSLQSVVTLYDVLEQVACEISENYALWANRTVSFAANILPVLQRMSGMYWIEPSARLGYWPGVTGGGIEADRFRVLSDNDARPSSLSWRTRHEVFNNLKNPAGGGGSLPISPYTTLTPLQYERFRRWSVGDFVADWSASDKPIAIDDLPPNQQLHAINRAYLESCCGGPFRPGVEVGPIIQSKQIYDAPFRVSASLPPGSLTQELSLPWQADYVTCGMGAWPATRPVSVTQDGSSWYDWMPPSIDGAAMVKEWPNFGFVKRVVTAQGDAFFERQRLLPPGPKSI